MTENPQYATTNLYFRCGGCGRIVLYTKMQEHYDGTKENSFKPHELGLVTDNPPAPLAVANPPAPPMFGGYPIPPVVPPTKTGSIAIDIILMKRSHPKAFWVYTALVVGLTALAISSLFADILLFRI